MLVENVTPNAVCQLPALYVASSKYQPFLDTKALQERICTIGADRACSQDWSFNLEIPEQYAERLLACLEVDERYARRHTISVEGDCRTGMSVLNVRADAHGNVVKRYGHSLDCMRIGYAQYQLARYGLAPPVVELPDCQFNRDLQGYQNTRDKFKTSNKYVSKKARIIPANDPDVDFCSMAIARLRDVFFVAGIRWHDCHRYNFGVYNDRLVCIDTGGMSIQESHYDLLPKLEQHIHANSKNICRSKKIEAVQYHQAEAEREVECL